MLAQTRRDNSGPRSAFSRLRGKFLPSPPDFAPGLQLAPPKKPLAHPKIPGGNTPHSAQSANCARPLFAEYPARQVLHRKIRAAGYGMWSRKPCCPPRESCHRTTFGPAQSSRLSEDYPLELEPVAGPEALEYVQSDQSAVEPLHAEQPLGLYGAKAKGQPRIRELSQIKNR